MIKASASSLWCETVGIKFGTNLNAYTSIDETVYNISNARLTAPVY